MIRASFTLGLALAVTLAAACGGDDDCSSDEVQVAYLGTSNDRTECRPIPAECGATADCGDTDCIRALYGLCESPAFGVGCSDTFPPTIVSCNE
jgi:hypothetical protein